MKSLFIILLSFTSTLAFSQVMHAHIPDGVETRRTGSGVETIDAKREIVFSKVWHKCKVCKEWFMQKEHIDTIDIVEKFQPPKVDMTLAQFIASKKKHVHKPVSKTPTKVKPKQKKVVHVHEPCIGGNDCPLSSGLRDKDSVTLFCRICKKWYKEPIKKAPVKKKPVTKKKKH